MRKLHNGVQEKLSVKFLVELHHENFYVILGESLKEFY